MRLFRARAVLAADAGEFDQAAYWLDRFYRLKRAQAAGLEAAA